MQRTQRGITSSTWITLEEGNMQRIVVLTMVGALATCSTPIIMLKHDTTGQIARCGGGAARSMAVRLIGYTIEKSSDEQCAKDYESRGFKRL